MPKLAVDGTREARFVGETGVPAAPYVFCVPRRAARLKTRVTYSLPPERDDGYRRGPSELCATVPQGTVATTVAQDWLTNELAEYGEIDAACRDRFVMHLMTAVGASAPADAVFRFTAGETMQTSHPTSASGEDDDEDTDRSEEYSDDGGVSD